MGGPFLSDEGFTSPQARRDAIAEEVQYYLAHQAGEELPPGVEVPDELPDALYWLLWVEKYGHVRGGGSLDQPWFFIQDVEAADLGRILLAERQAANERLRREHRNG